MRSAIVSLVTGEDPSEVLRTALDELQKDRSFVWSQEDDTFHQLDEWVGEIDFILAGHTHLERALPRQKKRALPRQKNGGWYLNSGTWARLIKLEPHVLASKEQFAEVYKAFTAKTMEALDACSGLVLRRRTVIAILPTDKGPRAELLHWCRDEGKLVPVHKDAGFTKES